MNNPAPSDEPRDPLQEALRRDAARVEEPPFDAALHRATMRRIRALTDAGAQRWHWSCKPALAAAAAVIILLAIVALRVPDWSEAPSRTAARTAQSTLAAAMASARAALASVSLESVHTVPSWMSPTAWLLEPPELSSAPLLPH